MLIIFDLDDTLIDTSGSVTPWKMRQCLERLLEMGQEVGDFASAYAELTLLNVATAKSKEAIQRFCTTRGIGNKFAQAACEELTSPLPKNFVIPTTPFAKEILDYYRSACPLALVTGGHPPFQLEKMKKAGIDSSIFSKIYIPEDSVKKPFYEGLLKEFSLPPHEVWVCGDRIEMDLLPGRELGIRTIHMRWGRGAKAEPEPWIDHAISDLRELKEIIR